MTLSDLEIVVLLAVNLLQTAILALMIVWVWRRVRATERVLANLYDSLSDEHAKLTAAHLYAQATGAAHVAGADDELAARRHVENE